MDGTMILQRPAPELVVFNEGAEARVALNKPLITLGRRPDRDVVLPQPHVSRAHAQIEMREGEYHLVDLDSSHGSFVNGTAVRDRALRHGDRIELGAVGSTTYIQFRDAAAPGSTTGSRDSRELLSQLISGSGSGEKLGELQMLQLFIEGARALNTASVLVDVLTSLVDVSLRLTKAERGFVFLRRDDERMDVEAGRNDKGETLTEADDVSHSVLRDVMTSASEFVMSIGDPGMSMRESIVVNKLRSIVCIPLRRSQFRGLEGEHKTIGVLYLDSRVEKGKLPDVSHELIRAIAREAAALVENAYLVKSEQEAQAYQRELAIAGTIQQSMMQVKIPAMDFAQVDARNICCKEIGGDFYDVMRLPDGVAVVLADVSGKGVSAALLACVLQGAIHPQLRQGLPLAQIAEMLNLYVQDKISGMKYATMVILRLYEDGRLEYINCGHLKPIVRGAAGLRTLENGNVPVGLISPMTYTAEEDQLAPGDQLILFSDGVVEAENADGDFYGDDRLLEVLTEAFNLHAVFDSVSRFRGPAPINDDCTAVVLRYGLREG